MQPASKIASVHATNGRLIALIHRGAALSSARRYPLPRSPALLPTLVDVHQGFPTVPAPRARAGWRQAGAPPEEEANAEGAQDDSDERSSQLDLLDALDQDGDERTQRRDADGGVEDRRDDVERQAERGGRRGGEHGERDSRRRGGAPRRGGGAEG